VVLINVQSKQQLEHLPPLNTSFTCSMSLANYFNDSFGNLATLDHFFDDVFNSRVLRQAQDVTTFRPK